MPLGKSYPAVQKAIDFVKDNLDNGKWQPGEYLPSTRRIAVMAGVSPATMIRAVAELKVRHLISGVERGRIMAGGEPAGQSAVSESQSQVWRLKRIALEQDILSGVYAHQGHLPPFKELQVRYGTCFRTMRKILRSMVDDEVVQLRGKKYELQALSNRSSGRRIVFVTYRIQPMLQSALNQGQYRVLWMFEQECIHRAIKLDTVEIDFYNAVETRRAALKPEISAPGLGYVVDVWWGASSDEFRRSHLDFLARLSAMQRPVALLDETGDFVLPLPFSENPLFQVFRIEGKRAGTRAARLLLGMGHRSVAYISASHNFLYSRQRLDGVVEQYARAGCAAGVRPVVIENAEHVLLHLVTIAGLDDAMIRKVFAVDRTHTQADDLFAAYVRFRESAPANIFDREGSRLIRKNLASINDLARRDLDPNFFNRMCRAAIMEASKLSSGLLLQPLFDRAFASRESTAWICVTDGVALTALGYLRSRGVSVPGSMSVVGFDNSPIEALEGRLTSFDFNVSGFVHGMLNYVMRPPFPRGHYHHVPMEVEGTIVQRNTTAQAPRSPSQRILRHAT